MDAALADLLKPRPEDETRTDEEYRAMCKVLLAYGQRLHDEIVAERRASEEIGAEIRAITERIKAI